MEIEFIAELKFEGDVTLRQGMIAKNFATPKR
jgi:hypothetical protein